ncbi:Rpn family recombination-promoting nuclease/putative transposase [Marinospirillum minutulum]|uniref:Rpn family recombination-promoting nuclease/putative transposase n=1 Tax=Marinospirillum minutulum TaxID=64974 RepID=UPI000405F1CF|nr:Rpn family recombination-promoting nuclease/putative transposase [Marinospirillum minutulum]
MNDNNPSQQPATRADQDSPWKVALQKYFKEFLQLLFTDIHDKIDWTKEHSFLDKELQQITADAQVGRRYADQLIKVYAKDGSEEWVLIHIEVQGSTEKAFAERMLTYWSRIKDRHKMKVLSLAVLADTNRNYLPDTFNFHHWGLKLVFSYPIAKLIDWEANWQALETSDNIFAHVVMAQIKAKRVKDSELLLSSKVGLIRRLFERGYSKEQVVELFNILDWMIKLPAPLELEFKTLVDQIQEEKKMPYINTFERLARQEGLQEGRQEGRQEAEERALQEKLASARQLLSLGVLNEEQIAEVLNLPLEKVTQLASE